MTVKDIEKRIIGCTSKTKNMSGAIIPIKDDGEYCAFVNDYGHKYLRYDTFYQVDNVHEFVKTYVVDFMCDIDEDENIYYLFIPNYEVYCIDELLWEVIYFLDDYKQYRQLYNFLIQYRDDCILSGIDTDYLRRIYTTNIYLF